MRIAQLRGRLLRGILPTQTRVNVTKTSRHHDPSTKLRNTGMSSCSPMLRCNRAPNGCRSIAFVHSASTPTTYQRVSSRRALDNLGVTKRRDFGPEHRQPSLPISNVLQVGPLTCPAQLQCQVSNTASDRRIPASQRGHSASASRAAPLQNIPRSPARMPELEPDRWSDDPPGHATEPEPAQLLLLDSSTSRSSERSLRSRQESQRR